MIELTYTPSPLSPHFSPLPLYISPPLSPFPLPILIHSPISSLPLSKSKTNHNQDQSFDLDIYREVIKKEELIMMVEKEDLGLSLSLNQPNHSLQLNLLPSSLPAPPSKPSWNDSFPSSDRNSDPFRAETRTFLRGIDVNRLPAIGDCEEDAGVSSPNSTISSVSGKRSEREANGEDHELERACSRGISDEEDGDTSRKKLRLSKDQSAILEESFKEHSTLNPKQKLALAKQLGLRPRQVEVWFQNRRARTKLKQTEVDCEFLKRWCENLTAENRRLQKEVQELRALKLSPQFYMQMTPPTTLTMCPSCERGAVPPSAVDPPPHHPQLGPAHHRPIINPWALAHGPIDTLRPRS